MTETAFRLAITGADELVPRLIAVRGHACLGHFALVLRPTERMGLLAVSRGDHVLVWKSEASDRPDVPEVPAALEGTRAMVQALATQALPKAAPIVYRGVWEGVLHCTPAGPYVVLERRFAPYAGVRVETGQHGWRWLVLREGRWFAPRKAKGKVGYPTLQEAIQAALGELVATVGEACAVRDTQRRAAHDAAYAAEHPIKPRAVRTPPVERALPEKPLKAEKPPKAEKPAKATRTEKPAKADKPEKAAKPEKPAKDSKPPAVNGQSESKKPKLPARAREAIMAGIQQALAFAPPGLFGEG